MKLFIFLSLAITLFTTKALGYKQTALDTSLLINICERCDLSHANFERANLSGADLLGANLREANLREAKLVEVNFSRADC